MQQTKVDIFDCKIFVCLSSLSFEALLELYSSRYKQYNRIHHEETRTVFNKDYTIHTIEYIAFSLKSVMFPNTIQT